MYHDISLHSAHNAGMPLGESPVPAVLCEQTEKAVVEALSKICLSDVVTEETYTGSEHREKVVGMISFVGDLIWTMDLILPHDSAQAIAQKFAGFDIPYESQDMGDVVGEVVNVIAGVLCGNLHSVGIRSQMSLPTVTRGNAFELMLPDNLVAREFYFSTFEDDFCVRITSLR